MYITYIVLYVRTYLLDDIMALYVAGILVLLMLMMNLCMISGGVCIMTDVR